MSLMLLMFMPSIGYLIWLSCWLVCLLTYCRQGQTRLCWIPWAPCQASCWRTSPRPRAHPWLASPRPPAQGKCFSSDVPPAQISHTRRQADVIDGHSNRQHITYHARSYNIELNIVIWYHTNTYHVVLYNIIKHHTNSSDPPPAQTTQAAGDTMTYAGHVTDGNSDR